MDIDGLKVVELKAKLNELGLSIKGNKTELVKRLKDHFYAADAAPVTATSTTTTSDATAANTSDATAASTTTSSDATAASTATTSTTVPSTSTDASPPIDGRLANMPTSRPFPSKTGWTPSSGTRRASQSSSLTPNTAAYTSHPLAIGRRSPNKSAKSTFRLSRTARLTALTQ